MECRGSKFREWGINGARWRCVGDGVLGLSLGLCGFTVYEFGGVRFRDGFRCRDQSSRFKVSGWDRSVLFQEGMGNVRTAFVYMARCAGIAQKAAKLIRTPK